jgi:hypothetical protein
LSGSGKQFGARHELDGVMGGERLRQRAWTGRDGHRRRSLLDFADEAKSALMQRADQSLIVAVVAQSAPRRTDSGAERRLRDDAAVPNRLDQLVLAHDPVAVLNEVNE